MVFGAIEYLNLLPFYIYVRKSVRSSQFKKIMEFNRGVPSEINGLFRERKVDYAFISSIASKGFNCSELGIIAPKEVQSVLVLEGEEKRDSESETSNRLAEVLNIKGQVIIGDKALRYYLSGGEAIDLAEEWYRKYGLPFVFAKLCFHKNRKFIQNISKGFVKPYIPLYIQNRYAKKLKISRKELLAYLDKIEYNCSKKSRKSFEIFSR